MKLKFYTGMLQSAGLVGGKPCRAIDGVLFYSDDEIDLKLYMEQLDTIRIYSDDLFYTNSIANGVRKVISYRNNYDEVDLPLKIQGEVQFVDLIRLPYLAYYTTGKEVNDEQAMLVYDLEKGRNVRLPFTSYVWISDSYIHVKGWQERQGFFACVDWEGRLIWRYDIGKKKNFVVAEMFEYKDSVVFSSGDYGDGKSHLVRLEKNSGEVVWKKTFDAVMDNALMLEDKWYVAIANQMLVISAENSDVLVSFKADLPDTEESTNLWSDGQLLYVFAANSNQILCYSSDGTQLIKTYHVPEHPRLRHGLFPRSMGGAHYLGLKKGSLEMSGAGVISWTTEDVLAKKELEIEEKPVMNIIRTQEDDKSHSYYVVVPCRELHEVLRFGEIEAESIAALRGKQIWDNRETRDKKFNGQIKLLIDPVIGKKNSPYLDMLAKRSTFFATIGDIKSGNGKRPIEVTWAFMDEV